MYSLMSHVACRRRRAEQIPALRAIGMRLHGEWSRCATDRRWSAWSGRCGLSAFCLHQAVRPALPPTARRQWQGGALRSPCRERESTQSLGDKAGGSTSGAVILMRMPRLLRLRRCTLLHEFSGRHRRRGVLEAITKEIDRAVDRCDQQCGQNARNQRARPGQGPVGESYEGMARHSSSVRQSFPRLRVRGSGMRSRARANAGGPSGRQESGRART